MRALFWVYHAANHTTTGKPPSELMFGRRIRTKLPSVPSAAIEDGEVRDRDRAEKEKGREYADNKRRAKPSNIQEGDQVLVKQTKKKNKLSTDFANEQFEVVQKKGTDVTLQSSSSGKIIRRSAAHLKIIPNKQVSAPDLVSPDDETGSASNDRESPEAERVEVDQGPVREKRTRTESKLLKDYYTY